MSCPICKQRRPRRDCPALGQSICTLCCGTKRLVEIRCPDNCVYLAAARANPAAAVRRQEEADAAVLLPTIQHLTKRQHQLFFLFLSVVAGYQPEGFTRLVDDDVADAAGAVAATLETAAKGVIYEHPAQSLVGQTLAGELTSLLKKIRDDGATVDDREAAVTLRAIEQGVRTVQGGTSPKDTYLGVLRRVLQLNRALEEKPPHGGTSSIVLP